MKWDGVDVHYPRYLSFPRNLFLASSGLRMYSAIKGLVRQVNRDFRFDIVHAHVALPDGFAGVMLKRRFQRPLVVTIHGVDLYRTIHRGKTARKALARVFEEADRVVVVSSQLARIARDLIGREEILSVVSNGVSPGIVASPHQSLIDRYAGFRIMVSVSDLIPRKCIDVNLNAVSTLCGKYTNLKYLVIGSGPEMARLKRLARNLGLEARVEFLGNLPHDKAMEYMAIADVFSLPSYDESFGMVYVEAAIHGKPVIACEGEGIEDIFRNNESALFVRVRNVESLSKALDSLLGNPQKSLELGQRAKRIVLENYTWAENARKYMDIYRELTAKHA